MVYSQTVVLRGILPLTKTQVFLWGSPKPVSVTVQYSRTSCRQVTLCSSVYTGNKTFPPPFPPLSIFFSASASSAYSPKRLPTYTTLSWEGILRSIQVVSIVGVHIPHSRRQYLSPLSTPNTDPSLTPSSTTAPPPLSSTGSVQSVVLSPLKHHSPGPTVSRNF